MLTMSKSLALRLLLRFNSLHPALQSCGHSSACCYVRRLGLCGATRMSCVMFYPIYLKNCSASHCATYKAMA
jgi:hypothetical protein